MRSVDLADLIERRIAATVENPAEWLLALRKLAEQSGLKPARYLSLPATLGNAAFQTAREAHNQGDAICDRLLFHAEQL